MAEIPLQHILQNVDELWREELDYVDTCDSSPKRVIMFLPDMEPTALPAIAFPMRNRIWSQASSGVFVGQSKMQG